MGNITYSLVEKLGSRGASMGNTDQAHTRIGIAKGAVCGGAKLSYPHMGFLTRVPLLFG